MKVFSFPQQWLARSHDRCHCCFHHNLQSVTMICPYPPKGGPCIPPRDFRFSVKIYIGLCVNSCKNLVASIRDLKSQIFEVKIELHPCGKKPLNKAGRPQMGDHSPSPRSRSRASTHWPRGWELIFSGYRFWSWGSTHPTGGLQFNATDFGAGGPLT